MNDEQTAKLEQIALEVLGISNANHRGFLSGDLHEELAYLDSLLHDPILAMDSYGPKLLQGLIARRASCWNEIQRRKRLRTLPMTDKRYSPENIKALREKHTLSSVVERLTGKPANPRGKTVFRVPCLVHHGEGLNMSCNEASGLYHCFVCHAGGDVVDLVRRVRDCTFVEALRWLEGI